MPLFTPAQLIFISVAHALQSQSLERVREPLSSSVSSERPSLLTDDHQAVSDYTRAMETKMALLYSGALEIIHRTLPRESGGIALDVACGPGHLAIQLARHMGFAHITGVDLSAPMIHAAEHNAKNWGLSDRVTFRVDDAMRLSTLPDNHFDLSTFTFAAHHFNEIEDARQVLASLDRVTRPEGLVIVFDVIRLKTRRNTERYIRVLGHDYLQRGLRNFFDDFRHSMYAAWTGAEFKRAVPAGSSRTWLHWVPRLVPSLQILFGLPAERKKLFIRPFFKKNPLMQEWVPRWEKTLGQKWVRQTLAEGFLNKISLATGRKERVLCRAPLSGKPLP